MRALNVQMNFEEIQELRMSTNYSGRSPFTLVEDTEEAWRQHDNPEIEPNPEAWDPS